LTSKKIINIITLGCSKNTVDSEHLAGRIDQSRFEVRHESLQDSDIVIINTCGFIGDAKEESVDTILSFAAVRKRGKIKKLLVIGCLVERYRKQLLSEIHEVDAFIGVNNLNSVVELIQGSKGDSSQSEIYNYKRTRATADHFAYLKISEGCDRSCSFCAIPHIRGKHKSIPMEELVKESTYLAGMGVKELILIAQDLTYYGIDLYGSRKITDLVEQLSQIEGIEWIRLQYMYPHNFPMDLAILIANNKKVCNYLDLPLQHINDRILKSMKRGMGKADTMELVEKLRRIIPDVAFRTTFIVGYPGETQEEFDELLNYVKAQRFERVGVFTYSAEEDTSAFKLLDDVPDQIKQQRLEILMELQQQISLEHNISRIESTEWVLIDRSEGGYYVARTQYDSPEVDNEVLIDQRSASFEIGEFYKVRITSADFFDVHALPV
jgi:ribosomal protein S12 methylthiotransferase